MKKIIRYVLLALLGGLLVWTFYYLWKKSQPVAKVYEIVSPSTTTIERKTMATGKVQPRQEVLVKPQISGIVSAVYKEAGQKIKAGEVIATIQVIPEMTQLNAADLRMQQADISLKQITQVYERQTKLYERGVISQEDMESAEADYKKAKQEYQAANDNYHIVKEGASGRASQVSNTQVRATITGTILDVPIKVGNSVIQANTFNDGTTIASIADMSDMIFVGKVDETEVGRIKERMPIVLSIGAIEDSRYDAVLEYVSPKGVEENGAIQFEVKAAVSVADTNFIRAGYSANAEIILKRADSVLAVPEHCVEFTQDSAFVYVTTQEEPKQEFVRTAVTTGLSDGMFIEIQSGLAPDARIRGAEIDPKTLADRGKNKKGDTRVVKSK